MPQDDAEAVAWYRRAAEQGHALAQSNLGAMYDQGRGVPQDDVEAHMWLTIAASRSTGAERELIVTARDAVAVRMTPTDLREAERRAQAWHAAHQDMRNRAAPPSDTGREGLIIALGSLSQGEHGSAAKSDREVWSKCRKKTGHPTSVLTRLGTVKFAGRHPKSMPNMLCSSSVEIAMPWGGFDRVFVNLTVPVSGFMGPDSATKMEISAESYRLGHGCLTSRAPR